jgi:predicted MPP superfamily phosphohydrolase
VDLVLAGHTHGGQIRVPLLWRAMLPDFHAGLVAGMYRRGGTNVYVSRGLGTSERLPLRLRCPAELTFFTVRGAPVLRD